MQAKRKAGIYCLTNDGVLEWTIALLESIRVHEPDRPIILIPFDDRTQKIQGLAERYRFSWFDDASTLKQLDRIGASFNQEHFHVRVFRKFASFWGPFEDFIFVDSDVILLGGLDEVFDAYQVSGCEFVANDPDMNQVYRPGAFCDKMVATYSAIAFNAGFFLSSKNVFVREELERFCADAQKIADSFSAVGGEQPFLNYCVHTKGLRYKSLSELVPGVSVWTWAKQPIQKRGSDYRLNNPSTSEHNKRLLYVHWSGIPCNPVMPNRDIFLRYRLNGVPWPGRLSYRVLSLVDWWKKYWMPKISRRLAIAFNAVPSRRATA